MAENCDLLPVLWYRLDSSTAEFTAFNAADGPRARSNPPLGENFTFFTLGGERDFARGWRPAARVSRSTAGCLALSAYPSLFIVLNTTVSSIVSSVRLSPISKFSIGNHNHPRCVVPRGSRYGIDKKHRNIYLRSISLSQSHPPPPPLFATHSGAYSSHWE